MKQPPDWARDGCDWPNRASSRFVTAAGLRWHVQIMGQGPVLLLIHGTGAATHSWRDLLPLLARHYTVLAPDLPGHGFTAMPPRHGLSLPGMARSLGELLRALDSRPLLVCGHSAGAAILARMCLDGHIAPRVLISLNGALLPLSGLPGQLFSPIAKLLAVNPLVPRLFAWRASNRTALDRLIDSTGSRIDARGIELYGRLVRNPAHVAGALGMMANWDLRPLERDLPRLAPRLVLVVGERDGTIPPREAWRVRALLPSAWLVSLPGLGHLAHEERPRRIAALILREERK
jgi:magnesium chelatase accessory protein